MSQCDILKDEEKLRLEQLLRYEKEAYRQGYRAIAGLDEAGRGPLAGPVVAAACILPRGLLIEGADDSKKLSAKVRAKLFQRLTTDPAIFYGIGIVESQTIDQINIYQATIQAMWQAVGQLAKAADYLLIDGMGISHASIPCLKIIKGDQLSLSIAAASIIAKETRDKLMVHYHHEWPHYGFDKHKGYGTEKHLAALEKHGPCSIHRRSFDPIKTKWPT